MDKRTWPPLGDMSSAFCSIEEAFTGPVMPGKKGKDKSRTKEKFVPGPMSGAPDHTNTVPEAMSAPAEHSAKPEAAAALHDFFPLPGETAEPEEWAKAFTLEGSNMPRPDGSIPVAGKSTLWRKIQAPTPAGHSEHEHAPVPSDIQHRLDRLTRQLDSLVTSSPMQSTAELFLFVAIGLLFLLAIDTLLRCATSVALSTKGGRYAGGGRGLSRRWR